MSTYHILQYIPLAGVFYFVVMPIWLIVLTVKYNKMRDQLQSIEGTQSTPHQREFAPDAVIPQKIPVDTSVPVTPEPLSQKTKISETPHRSFEERIGVQWFQWIGIAALVIALLFFMKWAFDSGYIGPTGRTVIGYLLAGGAILAGDRLRKKNGTWALTFSGGGALAAYIVTWIAFHQYELFPGEFAFLINILITVVICMLAGYYRAIALAVFGILGGFVTPILTGEGGSVVMLLSYILILDLGVLALSHVCRWRILNALAFVGTILWEIYALEDGGILREHALIFVTAFATIFILVPAIYNVLKREKSEPGDLLILIGNGLVHFWIIWQWMEKDIVLWEQYGAFIALGFSALFLLVSVGIYQQNKKDTLFVLACLGLTVLFASIAIPLKLTGVWISAAWSIEAAFLAWMALELKDNRIQILAWPVMIAAYVWYFFVPISQGDQAIVFLSSGFTLFLFWVILLAGLAIFALQRSDRPNSLFPFALFGCAILVVGLFVNIFEIERSDLDFTGRLIEAIALICSSYLVLWQAKFKWSTLSAEEKKGFAALGIGVQIITLAYFTLEYKIAIDEGRLFGSVANPQQAIHVGISILWALYATTTLIIGFLKGFKPLRLFSIILILIAVGKLALFDIFSLGTGYRVIGFTTLGALLVGSSFLYQRNKEQLKQFFVDTSSNFPS